MHVCRFYFLGLIFPIIRAKVIGMWMESISGNIFSQMFRIKGPVIHGSGLDENLIEDIKRQTVDH